MNEGFRPDALQVTPNYFEGLDRFGRPADTLPHSVFQIVGVMDSHLIIRDSRCKIRFEYANEQLVYSKKMSAK